MTVSAKGVKEAACNSRSAPKVCTQFADCGFVTAAGCGARCFACVLLLLLLLLLFTFFFFAAAHRCSTGSSRRKHYIKSLQLLCRVDAPYSHESEVSSVVG